MKIIIKSIENQIDFICQIKNYFTSRVSLKVFYYYAYYYVKT